MKVLILAGGKGTRFREETDVKPKPMIEVSGKPIILHIIEHYVSYGYKDFVILAGYKLDYFFEYFNNSKFVNKDNVFKTKDNLTITVLDTGVETGTGGRIKRAEHLIDEESFLLTYGDGLSSVNIEELVNFHIKNNKIATVTAVRPPARFGSLTINDSMVTSFGEKVQSKEGWINGGFFVLNKEVFNYINDDEVTFEQGPLDELAKKSNLVAYKHKGFWYPIDTIREKEIVESLIKDDKLPWLND
tara:strand:- start:1002 stop:1736 length:735 start_codon:yes stop_codon:yes gene_type:complete